MDLPLSLDETTRAYLRAIWLGVGGNSDELSASDVGIDAEVLGADHEQ